MLGGLVARSDSSRAISRSMSRCLRSASRIAVSAAATSSATAAKAARHSASGRASPFSPSPAGEASAKRSANLRRAVAALITPPRLALSSLSASMRLSSLGQIDRRRRARRLGVDGADGELCPRLALDPQRGRIQRQREIFRHQGVVAGRKVERDHARDAGAIGIDGDGIDGRGGLDIGRPRRHGGKAGKRDQAGRDKNVGNRSHEFPPSNLGAAPLPVQRRRTGKGRITTCGETPRPRNWFD